MGNALASAVVCGGLEGVTWGGGGLALPAECERDGRACERGGGLAAVGGRVDCSRGGGLAAICVRGANCRALF